MFKMRTGVEIKNPKQPTCLVLPSKGEQWGGELISDGFLIVIPPDKREKTRLSRYGYHWGCGNLKRSWEIMNNKKKAGITIISIEEMTDDKIIDEVLGN